MAVRTLPQRLPGQSFEAVAVVSPRICCWSGQRHPEEFPAQRQLDSNGLAVAQTVLEASQAESIKTEYLGARSWQSCGMVWRSIIHTMPTSKQGFRPEE